MARRKYKPIVNGVYHLLNRGNYSQDIFTNKRDYRRFMKTVFYYQNSSPPLRFSHYIRLPPKERALINTRLGQKTSWLVKLHCYCLMPNHFHFLVTQMKPFGVEKFMGNIQNSYTRYINTKNERPGTLFQGPYRLVPVETDEQLLHLSRYIHLNPFSAGLVTNLKDLENYPWSSYLDYLGVTKNSLVDLKPLADFFNDSREYCQFVENQANYQKELERIKHLALD